MKTNEAYCGSSMCRNGCTSMLNFGEPCAHYPIKTPMQELIEQLKEERDGFLKLPPHSNIQERTENCFGSCIEIAERMLEKEKEVMVEFAQDFEVSMNPYGGRTIQPDELFDETFRAEKTAKDVVCSECGSEDEVQISIEGGWKMYCKNCCPVRNAKTPF
jgi:hypothetical protein